MAKKRRYVEDDDESNTTERHLKLTTKFQGSRVTSTFVQAPCPDTTPVESQAPNLPRPRPPQPPPTHIEGTHFQVEPPDTTPSEPAESIKPKNKFTTAFYLEEWKKNRCNIHMDRLLSMEQRLAEKCSAPNCQGSAIFQCLDCLGRPVSCQTCCVSQHERLPFHRVRKWNGSFFMPTWLIDVGLVIQLGHNGLRCPAITTIPVQPNTCPPLFYPSNTRGTAYKASDGEVTITVVDVSAVHQVRIRWCKCKDADPKDLQLFSLGLFPFSFDEPRSAMTFQALDEVRLTNLECHTPISRWYSKVSRATNPTFPFMVKDREREVGRAERMWRHLSQLITHGFGHTGANPGDGELADFCVACPQPGFNLPANWREDPQGWKYCRNIIVDGNFSADHVKMQNSDSEILPDGTGYMAAQTGFKAHMKTAVVHGQHATCHEHKAATHTSSSKKHLDITGVCGAACSRHGCWVPGSMTNFSKGEAQPPVDYSVDRAFKYRSDGLEEFTLLYDINYHYGVHHRWRFEHSPCISFPKTMKKLNHGVGLFHVHGHIEDCEFRYSPTYIPGVGRISGEIIETLWEPLNPIAPSTRVSSLDLRREVMDDHMADSNWKKEYRMVDATLSRYNKATEDVKDAVAAFEDLSNNLTTDQIKAYTQAEADAQLRRHQDVRAMDVYAVKMEKAPSATSILSNLMRKEMEEPQCLYTGAAHWVSEGLKLEADILILNAHIISMPRMMTEKQSADLASRRQRLRTRIDAFNKQAAQYLVHNEPTQPEDLSAKPADSSTEQLEQGLWRPSEEQEFFEKEMDEGDENDNVNNPPGSDNLAANPEDATLCLPSYLGQHQTGTDLRRTELELRQGVLNDSIHNLRLVIADKSVVYRTQVCPAKSHITKTRAWDTARSVQRELHHHRRVYNHSRRAIIALGASKEDLKIYQQLEPGHLRASTAVVQPNARGQRDVNLSWIWSFQTGNSNNSEWLEEIYRTGWLKAKARRDRTVEELHILSHEMDWIINAFQFREDRWNNLASLAVTRSQAGHACFAKYQASLAQACKERAVAVFGDRRASMQGSVIGVELLAA